MYTSIIQLIHVLCCKGMGKSVQVLSLILLLRVFSAYNPSASSKHTPLAAISGHNRTTPSSANVLDRYRPDPTAEPHYHDEVYCLCGRAELRSADLCWVQCMLCERWSHASCYGFTSVNEAEACEDHRCLSCNCYYHYYFNGRTGGYPSTKLSSKASVILMPSTLTSQWLGEIDKHIPGCLASQLSRTVLTGTNTSSSKSLSTSSYAPPAAATAAAETHPEAPLKVFVYEGCDIADLKRRGYSFVDLDPYKLAQYDIVIVSLRTLQKEFHLTKATTSMFSASATTAPAATRSKLPLTHTKNYTKIMEMHTKPSPLPPSPTPPPSATPPQASPLPIPRHCLDKIRQSLYHPPPILCMVYQTVIVDETQKIESESKDSQALYMAMQVDTVHRISVSGTPLGNERVSDLHSLAKFLRIHPFDTDQHSSLYGHWNRLFNDTASVIKDTETRYKYLADVFSGLILRRTKQNVSEQLLLEDLMETVTPLVFSEVRVLSSYIPLNLALISSYFCYFSVLIVRDGAVSGEAAADHR